MRNKIFLSELFYCKNFMISQIRIHRQNSDFLSLFPNSQPNILAKSEMRYYSCSCIFSWSSNCTERSSDSNVGAKQLRHSTILQNFSKLLDLLGKRNVHTNSVDLLEAQGFGTSVTTASSSVSEVLASCKERLRKEEIDEAILHAEYIVAHALGITRTELYRIMNEHVTNERLENIENMMQCRLAKMPLQYILGDWDFHTIKLKLRPPVFIPRQETEGLVNLAIIHLREIHQPLILDIGCGSGAISLVLLNHFPRLVCVALDQSKYATELTTENALDLNLSDRLHVIQGKLTDESVPSLPFKKFDLIVSNPPYVLQKDLIDLQPEIMLYEDLRALDGGKEGLDVVSRIILHGQHLLKEDGCLLMEIDPCHHHLLPIWLEKNKTTLKISQFYEDNYGLQRYVKIVHNSNWP